MEKTEEENAVIKSLTTDLIVLKILEHVSVHDLTSCRLVNSLWNVCASTWLRERGKTVKLAQEDGLKALSLFKPVVTESRNSSFPFSRFKIDLSVADDEYNESLQTVLKIIKERPKIKKLKLVFDLALYFSFDQVNVLRNALHRENLVSLENLEHLSFVITLFEGFEPIYANIESAMKSKGIKKLGVVVTCFINRKMGRNLSLHVFRTIFNPSRVCLQILQELMIRFECVNESVLDILIQWNHPLKSLNLSVIAIQSNTTQHPEASTSILKKLHEFLSLQKNTLKNLHLQFTMNDDDARNLISVIGLNKSIVNDPRNNRQPDVFPKLPELVELSLSARYSSEIGILWRLNPFNFSHKFPKLTRLYLKNWEVSLQEDIPFLPVENVSYQLIERVQLPNIRQPEDCLIIPKILIAMPNVHNISIHFRPEVLEAIYRFAPQTLEKMTLFLSSQHQNLDPILMGISSLEYVENWTWQQIVTFPATEFRLRPSLLSIKNLKELTINTESTQANITDVTAVHILMELEHFCQLTLDSFPWDGISSWRFSDTCKIYMQPKIKLKLTQYSRTKRYNLM